MGLKLVVRGLKKMNCGYSHAKHPQNAQEFGCIYWNVECNSIMFYDLWFVVWLANVSVFKFSLIEIAVWFLMNFVGRSISYSGFGQSDAVAEQRVR